MAPRLPSGGHRACGQLRCPPGRAPEALAWVLVERCSVEGGRAVVYGRAPWWTSGAGTTPAREQARARAGRQAGGSCGQLATLSEARACRRAQHRGGRLPPPPCDVATLPKELPRPFIRNGFVLEICGSQGSSTRARLQLAGRSSPPPHPWPQLASAVLPPWGRRNLISGRSCVKARSAPHFVGPRLDTRSLRLASQRKEEEQKLQRPAAHRPRARRA